MSQQQQPLSKWEADKMLDVYIYDYLMKRRFGNSAKAFQEEAHVPTDPVAIDAPGGFLFEWWSVFWDIFITRSNEKHSEAAAAYLQTQRVKAQEQQQQSRQLQMQHLLMQGGHAQGIQQQRDASIDAASLKRFGENASQILDPYNANMLKSPGVGYQPPGQTLIGVPGSNSGNHAQVQNRIQPCPGSTQDFKPEMNPIINARSFGAVQERPPIGVNGPNPGGSNMTLNGWPMPGLDPLRSGLFQPKSLNQASSIVDQLQLQKPLLLQAQQNMSSPLPSDLENRKLRMPNSQRQSLGRDGKPIGSAISKVGSPMQVGSPGTSLGDDMLMKFQQQQMQGNSQLSQQYLQHTLSGHQSQISNHGIQQQDKITVGIVTDGSISNTLRGNNQVPKVQTSKKRKDHGSSPGPANTSGAANNTEPSPSSAPSTPSIHTPGDGLQIPNLHVPANGATSSLPSAPNHMAEIDDFINDEALDDMILPENGDPIDAIGLDTKGSAFAELRAISANTKVECCHFSSDGKLLVTGGHDKKVVLWCAETFTMKSTLEEHGNVITDARFSPTMLRIATSSVDRTVRVWDVDNPEFSIRTFSGHSTTVMSVDFHPCNDDIVCSADVSGEIRYWSIMNGSCCKFFKGGVSRVRFQPRQGTLLAGAADNIVSLFDFETQACQMKLQGHKNRITCLCWDPSGELLASVSEEVVKVWSFSTGKGECVHELKCTGSDFHTCIFHPGFSSLLVIGCYKSLEIWNMIENQTRTLKAHTEVISSLAGSKAGGGIIASASHDKSIKIWK